MATHKINDVKFIVGSGTGTVDLSAWVKSIEYTETYEGLDDTRMGHNAKANIAGLLDAQLSVDFAQDYGSSAVDATLSGYTGTVVPIEIRPTSGTVSATNPKWTGTMLLTEYQPIGGQVGNYHMTRARFVPSGGTALARGTA